MTPAERPTAPLRIAVVGHTNAGKTSLLRTLSRRSRFGEVSPSPATTRRIEPIDLLAGAEPVATLVDTPGLEDPMALLERIDAARADRREAPDEALRRVVADPATAAEFPQERAALAAALDSDLLIAVIDARDRVLPRHLDELEILGRCGRPLVPLLNFVASPEAKEPQWREALARRGLHAVAAFDTVVFDAEGEIRLLEALRTLAAAHRPPLDRLIADRRERERLRRRGGAARIAELLLDAATAACEVEPGERRGRAEEAMERLRARLRELERRCRVDLLALSGFEERDAAVAEAELEALAVGVDLFSPAALRAAGLTAAGGAAAGAAAGVALDLALGGMSLGAAAALGATVGGVLGASGRQARRLVLLARGGSEVVAGDPVLLLLLARAVLLARAIGARGHASVSPIEMPPQAGSQPPRSLDAATLAEAKRLLPRLHEARARLPRRRGDATSALRERLRAELSDRLESMLAPAPR